jgi:hypothetical protein
MHIPCYDFNPFRPTLLVLLALLARGPARFDSGLLAALFCSRADPRASTLLLGCGGDTCWVGGEA